jgi:hypothetical protein
MFRTDNTVGMLKSIALIAGLAILLWSLGLPSLQFADAANLSSVSDTVTDSTPGAGADHDIKFTTSSLAATGSDIVLTFPSGTASQQFDLSTIGKEDIDLSVGGSNVAVADWSVSTSSTAITITLDNLSIATSTVVEILIGLNATDGSPNSQIVNPSAEGSYNLSIASGANDTGGTVLAILSNVTVSASVDTIFTFAVNGVNKGTTFNGTATTTGNSSSTTIPFGKLVGGQATTTAQQLVVNTNAGNGYSVTVQIDRPLQSSTGGIIDGYSSESDTPLAWADPTPDVNDPTTWGYWGVTSDDATTTRAAQFTTGKYIAASTTPRVVMSNTGPVDGTGTGVGTTYVGYKVEISNLQEAGDDYSTTLTYVATPTF